MQGDIVAQGFELMLYGMGTVLAFLTVLVFATLLMSHSVERFFSEHTLQDSEPRSGDNDDPARVAVITAAVQRYRADRR